MANLYTMQLPYIIISPDRDQIAEIKAMAAAFPELKYQGCASGIEDGVDACLQFQPAFVFLEVRHRNQLFLISELMRFTTVIPSIIIVSPDDEFAVESMRYGCFDYYTLPFGASDLRKTMLRFNRVQGVVPASNVHSPISSTVLEDEKKKITNTAIVQLPSIEATQSAIVDTSVVDKSAPLEAVETTENIEIEGQETEVAEEPNHSEGKLATVRHTWKLCVKSHGDYRFIESDEIAFLKADNNSTDIHLMNGELVTAFKTLKLFEQALPMPFVRIHNSYIVNMDAIQRIHTGNAVLYLKPDGSKIPISKSYKDQVEIILNYFKKGQFLEI